MTQYTLYYWPIPFRGHPLRFVLAHVGASWDEPDFAEVAALRDLPVADKPYPFLAPPVLYDHGNATWLSQMPAARWVWPDPIVSLQVVWRREASLQIVRPPSTTMHSPVV